jgi:hypothetical protein
MPSSNTLETSRPDCLCIRRCVYKRHRREFKRLFKPIRPQYQEGSAAFVPMHTLAKPWWEPFCKRRRNESKCRKRSLYCEDHSLNSLRKFFAATKRTITGANLPAAGRGHKSNNFLSIEGGYMKRTILAVVLLTVACFSLPTSAQQQDLQEVMDATKALGARESELLNKKDASGIASLFTSDGLLVMLAPQFAFKPGRDAIQKHYQGIIDAGATSIVLELKNLELRGNDGVWAAGNYSV